MEEQFIKLLKSFDSSYNYSDDHNVWKRGQAQLEDIQTALRELHLSGFDMKSLLEKCLSEVEEEFTDGFTHRTINNLFKPYL